MSIHDKARSILLEMLKNPQAWTSYKGDYYDELRNSRTRCGLHRRKERIGWFRSVQRTSVWARFYTKDERGLDYGNEVLSIEINDPKAVDLWIERRDEKVLGAMQGKNWPSGTGCSYCGSIMTGGKCSSCGSHTTVPATI